MADTTQSLTQSLLDIVKGVQSQTIMLPEFQRDFRWELDQTYDLFDSLIRDIFVGTVIYGKPSFGMTLREMDIRPRKNKGKVPLKTIGYSSEEIEKQAQVHNLRIVLDGQQRITSIYRAITGIDSVYIILRDNLELDTIPHMSLEEMFITVAGEESATQISIKLHDAFETEVRGFEDEDLNKIFANSMYARRNLAQMTEAQQKAAEKTYRRGLRKIIDFFKLDKMLSYYLLDMSLDKFCLFFERSNSKGIQLNFTDILAAKLYHGFNLRRKIDEFESESKLTLNREIIVRAIAFITGMERGGTFSIDKSYILQRLDASDFTKHWDKTVKLYKDSIEYLTGRHYILTQEWIPSENMVIPLMMFLHQIKGFERMNETQREFIEFWYWASIFANRYSGSSNEIIITDSMALVQIARGERINVRGFFTKLRSLIQEPDDLFAYTKKASATYRGILNLIGYDSKGLLDWSSFQNITPEMRLEDHHIYPRAYISSKPRLDIDQSEAEQLVDCVVNRTLIPKVLNIQIGKKAPQTYLSELTAKNSKLADCLATHLMPNDIMTEPLWNEYFKIFLEERSQAIFSLIDRYAIQPYSDIAAKHSSQTDFEFGREESNRKARLGEMIADGRILIGDRIFVRKHPNEYATIIGDGVVEYQGQQFPINTWGQQMTGWPSINVYESIFLQRTNQPINSLR